MIRVKGPIFLDVIAVLYNEIMELTTLTKNRKGVSSFHRNFICYWGIKQ